MFCRNSTLFAAGSLLLVQAFSIAASSNSTYDRDKRDCIVPSFPNTEYSSALAKCESNCELKPNDVVNDFVFVKIRCKEPFILPDPRTEYVPCVNGKWAPENHACVQTCNPLISPTLDSVCTLKGDEVDCTGRIRPGTQMHHECKPGYVPYDGLPLFDNECLSNGTWIYTSRQSCTYRCGIVQSEPSNVPLISYGVDSDIRNHPWNAGLYASGGYGYKHICGGTLITPYLILTAAHCLYWENEVKIQPERLKIGLAKYYRDVNDPRDMNHAQLMDVERIIVSEFYKGNKFDYSYDLAVIELTTSVTLSRYVMPACIDTNNEFRLTSQMLGTVVGWGETENNSLSPTLQKARLPYYTQSECKDKLTQIAQNAQSNYISKDKFCAFYTNGTNVQHGDSGEGIIFEFNNRHYVFGVVSTQVRKKVSTFTDLSNQLNRKFICDELHGLHWFTNESTPCREIPVNSCSFPIDQPGTHFVLRSCNCRSSFVQPFDELLMTCSPGYVPFYENGNNIVKCNNGILSPKEQHCVPRPNEGAVITGGRPHYEVGEKVKVNCTSALSKQPVHLTWFINGEQVKNSSFLRGPFKSYGEEEGLERAILGLEFQMEPKHFKNGDLKLECLVNTTTIYLNTNEESVEGEKPQRGPVLEADRFQGQSQARPNEGAVITGGRPHYEVGEKVKVNCTSALSKQPVHLTWFINGEQVKNSSFLRGPFKSYPEEEGLERAILGLEFQVEPKHFENGDLKFKCLANITTNIRVPSFAREYNGVQ